MKKTSIQLAALLCALSLPALAADPVTVAKVDAKPKAQVPAAKPKAPAPAAKTDPNAKKAASKPVTVAKPQL